MSITLNVSTVRDIGVVAARMQWERARDRHDDACARRDALAHRALLRAFQHGYLGGVSPDVAGPIRDWLDSAASTEVALDQRRDALCGYTRALDGLIEDVRSVIKASAVQS